MSIFEAPGAYLIEDMPEDKLLWLMDNDRQRITESCFQEAEYVTDDDVDEDGIVVESGSGSRSWNGRRAFKRPNIQQCRAFKRPNIQQCRAFKKPIIRASCFQEADHLFKNSHPLCPRSVLEMWAFKKSHPRCPRSVLEIWAFRMTSQIYG